LVWLGRVEQTRFNKDFTSVAKKITPLRLSAVALREGGPCDLRKNHICDLTLPDTFSLAGRVKIRYNESNL